MMYESEKAALDVVCMLGPNYEFQIIEEYESGVIGFFAYLKDEIESTGDENNIVFKWLMFEHELIQEVQDVSVEIFLEFLRSEPDETLRNADRPSDRKIGFVSYSKPGISTVRLISLIQFKSMNEEDRQFVITKNKRNASEAIKFRASLMNSIESCYESCPLVLTNSLPFYSSYQNWFQSYSFFFQMKRA